MLDMTKTKCSFIISVQCPEKCGHVFRLPSNSFVNSNMIEAECPECKVKFFAKNINGGVNENNN